MTVDHTRNYPDILYIPKPTQDADPACREVTSMHLLKNLN